MWLIVETTLFVFAIGWSNCQHLCFVSKCSFDFAKNHLRLQQSSTRATFIFDEASDRLWKSFCVYLFYFILFLPFLWNRRKTPGKRLYLSNYVTNEVFADSTQKYFGLQLGRKTFCLQGFHLPNQRNAMEIFTNKFINLQFYHLQAQLQSPVECMIG